MSVRAPLLLVSVRDATEALAALAGGADIIDVKEPSRGPLGSADRQTMAGIAEAVASKRRLSAALGELAEVDQHHDRVPPKGYTWLKAGCAGFHSARQLWSQWIAFQTQIDERSELVVAAYADHLAARTLPASQIARALHGRYGVFLIDTYAKDGRSVFDHISVEQLKLLAKEVRATNASFALAGSLGLKHIDKISAVAPDIVGIRGAACEGGRTGRICEEKVSEFRTSLRRASNSISE